MKEAFKTSKFTGNISIKLDGGKIWEASKASICQNIISICNQFQDEGYTLTLRQLYYQLVGLDLIPNHFKVYKKLSALKDDIVYSGLVDWDAFEDRGRVPHKAYYETSVRNALQRTKRYYKLHQLQTAIQTAKLHKQLNTLIIHFLIKEDSTNVVTLFC